MAAATCARRTHGVRLANTQRAPRAAGAGAGAGNISEIFFCPGLPGSRRRRRRRERERYGVSASIRRGDPCFSRPNYCLRTPLCIQNDTFASASDTKWCLEVRKVIQNGGRRTANVSSRTHTCARRTHACARRTPRVRLANTRVRQADTPRAPRCSCARLCRLAPPRCSCAPAPWPRSRSVPSDPPKINIPEILRTLPPGFISQIFSKSEF